MHPHYISTLGLVFFVNPSQSYNINQVVSFYLLRNKLTTDTLKRSLRRYTNILKKEKIS